jgi:hypothetical protein
MVIKSMSRTSVSFRQLLRYMEKGAVKEKMNLVHNLRTETGDIVAIEREFLDNSRYLKDRKNGVVLYHEILSFSSKDREQLSAQVMEDLTRKYLVMRAPEALGYAVAHTNTSNVHIHIMISGNLLYSEKKLRQSKEDFARIKQNMEVYQKAMYPELTHSIVQQDREISPRKSRGEHEYERRERSRSAPVSTDKEGVALWVRSCLEGASAAEFEASLKAGGLSLYERSGRLGIIAQATGCRYRFSTLGVAEAFDQALAHWQAIRERQEAGVAQRTAKRCKDWREAGFREQLADLLLVPEDAARRQRRRQSRGAGRER